MSSAWRPTGWIASAPFGGACSMSSTSTSRKRSRNEHAADRDAAGVGGRARGTAGEGEGADPCPRCACRRTPPDAADGRRERVRVRGAGWPGEPARPLQGAPAADRLPLLLRPRRERLAREGLPRLL